MTGEQPPKTMAEIGVHIFYINKRLGSIEDSLKDSPSRREFDELEERVALVESFITNLTKKVATVAIVAIILAEAARWGLDKFIRL